MSNKQQGPDIVILSKGKSNPTSVLHEFLNTGHDNQQSIPLELLDSIFVTLTTGEKYKVNQGALGNDILLPEIDKILKKIGVPNNITKIEILLDIADADTFIRYEAASILDNIFAENDAQP